MSDTRTGAARTRGHVEVFALEGIPEVRPGGDLSALKGRRTGVAGGCCKQKGEGCG